MAKLFTNSEDPDQTPHSAASDLGLHCLPSTLLWVSQLQWVNIDTPSYLELYIGLFISGKFPRQKFAVKNLLLLHVRQGKEMNLQPSEQRLMKMKPLQLKRSIENYRIYHMYSDRQA